MKRKILAITGSRSDYSIMVPVYKAIKESTLSGDEKKALLVDIQMLQDSVAIKTMNGELLTSEELQLIAKYDALYEQD